MRCAAKGLREILSRHKLSPTSSFVSSHLKYCMSCRLVRLEDIKVLEHLEDLESSRVSSASSALGVLGRGRGRGGGRGGGSLDTCLLLAGQPQRLRSLRLQPRNLRGQDWSLLHPNEVFGPEFRVLFTDCDFGGSRDSCDDKEAKYFSLSLRVSGTQLSHQQPILPSLPLIYTISHAKKATDNRKHGTPVTPTLRPRPRRCGLGLAPGPFELAASPQMGMWSSCYDVGRCTVALGPGSQLRRGRRMPFLLRPVGLPARW